MIHELDDALRGLLRTRALPGTDVEITLDAPTKDWAARRNAPTVNMYLYDIREDLRRRQRGLVNEYDEDGMVAVRHMPPRYIKMSYLLTAWTQRPEDEHRLLSSLLLALIGYEAVPPELLTGTLAALALPVPMTVALPPPEDRAFADVWTALGGELKPSIDVVVSAPVDGGRRIAAGPPVREGLDLTVNRDTTLAHRRHPDGGTVDGPPGAAAKPRVAMSRPNRAVTGPTGNAAGPTGNAAGPTGNAAGAGGAARPGR